MRKARLDATHFATPLLLGPAPMELAMISSTIPAVRTDPMKIVLSWSAHHAASCFVNQELSQRFSSKRSGLGGLALLKVTPYFVAT